ATASVMSFSRSFVSIGIPSRGIPQVYHTFPFCPEKEIAPARILHSISNLAVTPDIEALNFYRTKREGGRA
ncbi:MAG: hypothetical protein LBD47_04070, partial [Treponema sp.]|nr:hypothetical protein [Treponema sp.]